MSWSDSRIVVRVPAGAQSGDVKVVATGSQVSGTKRIVVESASPQITSVSPRQVQPNQTVTITGSNFGSSRGSSSVWVGSVRVASFSSWSNTTIRFRVPTNMRSGNVTVRTANGTSNAVRLEITSGPSLSSVSPTRVKPGDRLTLTGSNFGRTRGSSYVLFTPNVWPTTNSDYVSWSDTRIVVKVPARAQSGDVKVVVGSQSSSTRRITVESAEVTIPFALAEAGAVRLVVYNLMGQQIRVLADGWLAAGAHRVSWNGRTDMGAETASGVYWVVLQVSDAVQTAKLALIR